MKTILTTLALLALLSSCSVAQTMAAPFHFHPSASGALKLDISSNGVGVSAAAAGEIQLAEIADDGTVDVLYRFEFPAGAVFGLQLVKRDRWRLDWVRCDVAVKLWPLAIESCPSLPAASAASPEPERRQLW